MAGISPEDSGKLKQGVSKKMDDVATANFLITEIAHGKRHVGDMLHTAWKELNRRFPHRDEPEKRWTERRLRGWWNKESQIVRHFQMVELFEAAEALKRARDEHAEYRAKTSRLRQMAELVAADENRGVAER
ncbi:hypothetical protein [Rhizobium leguminosarum]|uniref:hypothetical protein n=1 Tax=Rhizobium leguminosarum TaxID=384 RepID=UPI001FE1B93F|nr:hypothetical protein [Rhizobium leguminosarum]